MNTLLGGSMVRKVFINLTMNVIYQVHSHWCFSVIRPIIDPLFSPLPQCLLFYSFKNPFLFVTIFRIYYATIFRIYYASFVPSKFGTEQCCINKLFVSWLAYMIGCNRLLCFIFISLVLLQPGQHIHVDGRPQRSCNLSSVEP